MLRDRFSEHQEFSYDDMWLSPLIIPDMLKVRFNWSKKRKKLSNEPKIVDIFDNNEYTFPRLYSHLFTTEDGISEGGRLIVSMAADNAREAIKFTDKLVYSDQLKGLRNISDPEFVVAALMLSDSSDPSLLSSSFILNLFNNDEPDKIGNTLIRFRVLEYFWHNNLIDLAEEKFQNYFQWIGYSIDRVKHVLQIFLMTQVIRSEKFLSSDALQDSDEEKIGNLKITNSGKEYKNLLTKQWYFVAIKRDVYLPESIIFSDEGREYCTHTNFIDWLNQQEENENRAKNNYESANGKFTPDWTLESPAKLAERALKGKKDG